MSAPAASPSSARYTRLGVLVVTVLVFGVVVAAITFQLQVGLRDQILHREVEMLTAIASMQLDDAPPGIPSALFVAVMKAQKLAGVSGLRIYDANRRLNGAFMLPPTEGTPPPELWRQLEAGRPVGRLHERLTEEQSASLVLVAPSESALEAWVPLRRTDSTALIGAAEFWLRGGDLTQSLAIHRRRLWTQAGVAWVLGSGVIAVAFAWAFRRLDAVNRELRARSDDLQRANRELVLAAKTSALGAVTAHLMHEIKNPLAGLELIVAGQSDPSGRNEGRGGGELAAASELTRRLRTMVNDVVGVLRDEQTGAEFELTCADVAEVVLGKVQADADQRGVKLESETDAGTTLTGRRANLVILVLRNLLQNALEATRRGGTVKLTARSNAAGGAEFLVEDGGVGLPEAVRSRLFQPCTSTKVGGSGLGLALSHQLAQQAGGRLELVRSDERGTCFRLVLRSEA